MTHCTQGTGRRWAPFLLAGAIAAAVPAVAKPPVLDLPLECELGKTCYIQQYVDRDPGPGQRDFACGALANDGHLGTDIAVPTLADMDGGVAVLAAAAGKVRRTRDGMPDIDATDPLAPDLTDHECGNGVAIGHGNGWETQYCHLREGSVSVKSGQKVEAGTLIGLVGMSGLATFPHVHFSVRKGKRVIDPFLRNMTLPCGADGPSMWREPIAYRPGGLLAIGVLDRVPDYDEVKEGLPRVALPDRAPKALVVWGYVFAGQKGDVIEVSLTDPAGKTESDRSILDKNQPFLYRAWGKMAGAHGFSAGRWVGTVEHRRGEQLIDRRRVKFRIE